MNDGASLNIEGIEQTLAVLRGASDVVERRVLTSAVRRAAGRARKAIRAAAPVGETGVLKKSIRSRRVKTRERTGRVRYYVGTSRRGFYGKFLEYGTKRGHRAQNWMGNAMQGIERDLVETMSVVIVDRLPIELGKEAERRRAIGRPRRR